MNKYKLLQYKDFTGVSMKRFYILAFLFLIMGGAFFVNAQDLIILKDGSTIEAKVLEISPTEIRYKRFDHLDGPTIVIMAIDVLSIRYENGRTEIINNNTQSVITNTQPETMPIHNAKFNTLGFSLGYLGVSNFGFSLNATVSPSRYTFFDFGFGLGFANFSFNGNLNFGGFVPFNKGGWYIGAGLGGGMYEIVDIMNGYFTVNAITGFLFFNWLNISATLKVDILPHYGIRINPMVGYIYQLKTRQNTITNTDEALERQQKPKKIKQPAGDTDTSALWVCHECNTSNIEARIQCSNCRRTRKY